MRNRSCAVAGMLCILALLLPACSGGGGSGGVPAKPGAPAVERGDRKLVVSWAGVSGAKSYLVYYRAENEEAELTITTTAPTCLITGLTNGKRYYVWVRAANGPNISGRSPSGWGVPTDGIPSVIAPYTPPAPVLISSDSQVTITWDPIMGATYYEVYFSTTNDDESSTLFTGDPDPADTTSVITGLQNGTDVYVWLKAANSVGTSDYSLASRGTPSVPATGPAAPAAPTVTAGNTQLVLRWEAVGGASSYKVYCDTGNTPGTTAPLESSATTCTVTGLVNGTLYHLWVKAVNVKGESDYSPAATGTPIAEASQGSYLTLTAGSVSFNVVYVPAKSYLTDVDDGSTVSVSNPFWIGETEVTAGTWNTVYAWALANGYAFANAGSRGGGDFSGTPSTDQHPVTTINWRDALVWCNALTEFFNATNGTSDECVYTYNGTVVRDSRDENGAACDNAAQGLTAKGFRLPSGAEWELAARFRADGNNDGDIFDLDEYYPGNYASGATDSVENDAATSLVAVYNTISTAPVKSKAPNALGLYDMSGNADEWVFDWFILISYRLYRGESWDAMPGVLSLASYDLNDTYVEDPTIGLRVGKNP